MKKVHIIHDIYDKNSGTVAEVESVLDYLKNEFTEFPKHARIYHKHWNNDCDITEKLQKNENYADELDGDIYVVIYPSEIATILAWAVMAITAAFSIYTYLTMPKPAKAQQESPNNELAGRQNIMRPNGRIPEIFGKLRAYPDLIGETYTFYDDLGREVERSILCVTKGFVQIHDMKDATTDVSDISGTSISVYDPNTDITGTAIYKSGRTFTDLPMQVIKSASITGQVLDAPNKQQVDSDNLYFTLDGFIRKRSGDFSTQFTNGDSIIVRGATIGTPDFRYSGDILIKTDNTVTFESIENIPNMDFANLSLNGALVELPAEKPTDPNIYRDFSGVYNVSAISKTTITEGFHYVVALINPRNQNPSWQYLNGDKTISSGVQLINNKDSINLNGTYRVKSVGSDFIELDDPSLVNDEWSLLSNLPNQSTETVTLDIDLEKLDSSSSWVGWHNIVLDDAESLYLNFHFPNGLYRQNSKGGTSYDWTSAAVEYQYINKSGEPYGQTYREDYRFDGDKTRIPKGFTKIIKLIAGVGGIRFRLARTRYDIATNVVAEIRIKDVYLAKPSTQKSYKDLTIIQSEAVGNDGLYSIKARKLNCLVTRKLPLNGTGTLTATKSAAQALIYLALDDKNGRRKPSEVDIAQILSEEKKAIAYFGSSLAVEFSYTIDSDNLSFEEIAGMVSSSMFSESYRYGSKLRIRFEEPQQASVLLFSHRNIAPNTMNRTDTWGIKDGFDGVEIEYTSPDDDTRVNYIASDSAITNNLMKITTSGIRSHEQAKTRAWREWNKQKWQNVSLEFEALQESNLLARNDRILVADTTKLKTIDGEVVFIDGSILELSQPVPSGNYDIYLQLPDASVDIIPCVQVDEWHVKLNSLPSINLSIGRAFYQLILKSDTTTKNAYLVTEIRPQGKMTNTLTCVNYDARYYEKDHTFF